MSREILLIGGLGKLVKKFIEKTKCFEEQYSDVDLEKYLNHSEKVDGKITLGENIADNGRIRETFKAWKLVTNVQPEDKMQGLEMFTDEQLFFIAYANNFCTDASPLALEELMYEVHAPEMVRVNVPLSNFDSFGEAFKCPKGTPMNPVKMPSLVNFN